MPDPTSTPNLSNLRLGTAPDSWFPDNPKQVPWTRFLDEAAAAGYTAVELGPLRSKRRDGSRPETFTPLRPLAESVATLQVVDEVRHQLGITFVEETAPGVSRR